MNSFCKLQQSAGAITLAAVIVCSSLSLAQQPAAAPPSVETLHIELRALKDRAVKAVNERDEAALLKELNPDVLFTAMNNERVHGLAEVKAYYQKMMLNAGRLINSLSLTAEADELTTLYQGDTVGIVTGTSNTSFNLMSGLDFTVPLRWTATLVRSDNKWTIAGLHFSANMFDNPLLDTAGQLSRWVAIVGIPLALLIGFWFGSRRARMA